MPTRAMSYSLSAQPLPRQGRKAFLVAAGLLALTGEGATADQKLPQGFVYLRDVAPSIDQDMRYAGPNNFTGRPVPGYNAPECVLKRGAAEALKRAQDQAQKNGYSLKVFDCYRPARAVRAFLAWACAPEDGRTKRYYPHLKKSQLVPSYIASKSQHSAGIAADLTLAPATAASQEAAAEQRVCTDDGEGGSGLRMGTAFDCFDPKANTASPLISAEERKNRQQLRRILEGEGFKNYAAEWWHFSYPTAGGKQSYDFAIEPRPSR